MSTGYTHRGAIMRVAVIDLTLNLKKRLRTLMRKTLRTGADA